MRCPECKIKKRARPMEYDLADLLDHMLNEHPTTMLSMAREMLKSTAIDSTDVIFEDAPHGA